MSSTGNPFDPELQRLFDAYRVACPDRDASPDFMPLLWQKIEARRDASIPFIRRLTIGFASFAAAASFGFLLLSVVLPADSSAPSTSYVEALASAHAADGYTLHDVAYAEVPPEDAHSATEPRK